VQFLFRRLIVLVCVVFGAAASILSFTAMKAIPADQEISSSISGSILINITYFGHNFIEFKLQDGQLLKTSEGKVIPIDVEKNIPYTYSSYEFNKIYNLKRLYGTKEELSAILSQYDLERLYELRSRFIITKGKLDEKKYFLAGPGKDYKDLRRFANLYFLPNRQFSYLIYFIKSSASVGVLIDLNTKEISFPFGLDHLKHVTWNKEGKYVAYSIDKTDSSESVLVIKDISKQKTLLWKNLGKYISDVTWSPESSYVALLTYTSRRSLSPRDLLAAVAGHHIFFNTFYLEVYDLSGNLIYSQKINGEFKFSEGRLVWIP
jgi:hypothetical protein